VTIAIRPGASSDVSSIVESAAALFGTDALRHDAAATNLDWPQREGHTYYAELLDNADALVLIARDGADVTGHLVGRLRGPSTVHPIRVADLESIHVHAAYRGEGIGQQLLSAFLKWAAGKGAQRAAVTAYAANAGAQRFYARHGFTPRSVTMDLHVG
jgi:GNAT superfamily N-acetyltransferase